MGGILGIGGSAAKTDRKDILQSQGNLNNVFNYALPTGEKATSDANSYNSKILNGDRSSITQAMAPEVNSITGQADQAKKQEANMGTSRGGGTNAAHQQTQQKEEGAVTDMIAKARPAAAANEANIGSNLLGLGENAAGAEGQVAADSYKTSSANASDEGKAAGQLAMTALMMA